VSTAENPELSGGPCTPWVTLEEFLEAFPQFATPSEDPPFLQESIDAAVGILWALTARQFSGSCLGFVRPCRAGCSCWGPGGVGYELAGFGWLGGGVLGGWGFDGRDLECGCGWISELVLAGYPVTEILEVKIDGVVVDPTGYRLDRRRRLVRLADADGTPRFWPACQRLDLEPTEAGTWSVAYAYGAPPPAAGRLAAFELAEQFFLAATNPGACRLPTGVTKLTRQGITIERLLPMFAKDQRTGLVLTDAFLAAYNPSGLRRRPTIRSPGYPRYGRRTNA
jgi:hypothetical protein